MWTQKKLTTTFLFFFANPFIAKISLQAVNTTTKSANINCGNWQKFRSSCYKVFERFLYFHSAQEICQQNGGGELVSIQSQDENDFIRDLVESSTQNGQAWIGLKRTNNQFVWTNNDALQYKNWVIHRPTDYGHCTQMIRGGLWANILCYNQMQFVCKKAPIIVEDNSRLYLIIHISIPVACVSVMLLFVAFLCFKSYRELEKLKANHNVVNPFQIVQAAMELPTKPSDNLMQRSKGMTLWHSAINRIKEDKEKADNNNNNDNSNEKQIVTLSVPSAFDIAAREDSSCCGTIGAPVPAIVITKNEEDCTDKGKTDRILNSNNNIFKKQSLKQVSLSCPPALEGNVNSNDSEPSTVKIYKSKVGIWLKKNNSQTPPATDFGNSWHRKRAFSLNKKTPAIDQGQDDERSTENGDSTIFANNRLSNLVEVVVDVNVQAKPKDQSPENNSSLNKDNPTVSESDSDIQKATEIDSDVSKDASKNKGNLDEQSSLETEVEIGESDTGNKIPQFVYVEDRPFSEILRQESIKRRKELFPSLPLEDYTKDRKLEPFTQYKFVNGDYHRTTLV